MRSVLAGNFTPVLSTESKEEFEARRSSFRNDINPRDAIERMYCDDAAIAVWDIMRWRRIGVAIQNMALRNALYEVLVERLALLGRGQEAVAYLDQWFSDDQVKREISDLLGRYNLDVSAIEAETFRQCAEDLTLIDDLVASAESRRDKALRNLAFYRGGLAQQLQTKIIDMAQNENVPRLESKTDRES